MAIVTFDCKSDTYELIHQQADREDECQEFVFKNFAMEPGQSKIQHNLEKLLINFNKVHKITLSSPKYQSLISALELINNTENIDHLREIIIETTDENIFTEEVNALMKGLQEKGIKVAKSKLETKGQEQKSAASEPKEVLSIPHDKLLKPQNASSRAERLKLISENYIEGQNFQGFLNKLKKAVNAHVIAIEKKINSLNASVTKAIAAEIAPYDIHTMTCRRMPAKAALGNFIEQLSMEKSSVEHFIFDDRFQPKDSNHEAGLKKLLPALSKFKKLKKVTFSPFSEFSAEQRKELEKLKNKNIIVMIGDTPFSSPSKEKKYSQDAISGEEKKPKKGKKHSRDASSDEGRPAKRARLGSYSSGASSSSSEATETASASSKSATERSSSVTASPERNEIAPSPAAMDLSLDGAPPLMFESASQAVAAVDSLVRVEPASVFQSGLTLFSGSGCGVGRLSNTAESLIAGCDNVLAKQSS